MRHQNKIVYLVLFSTLISGCFATPTPVVFPTALPTVAPTETAVIVTEVLPSPAPTEPIPTATSEVIPTVSEVIIDFKNEFYMLEGSSDPIQLTNGKYENPDERLSLILSGFTLQSDLDGDGDLDGAAILELNTGGSGVFASLSVLLNDNGTLNPIFPYVIDDRVTITGISTKDEIIQVDYLGRTEDQPMTDEPTIPFIRFFAISDGELTEVDQNGVDLVQSFAVSGTIAYLQRITLQPEAEISIKLVDISKADAPAVLLEELTFTADGEQPPYQFVLPYNPDAIDPEADIVVEAKITINGKVIFASTKTYPVITRGNSSNVEIILEQVE